MSQPHNSSPHVSTPGTIFHGVGSGETVPAPDRKPKTWHYFKTTPGILKIISVVTGLVSLSLITFGYVKAELFSVKEKNCDSDKDLLTCKNYYRYEICKRRNSKLPESHRRNETLNCPSQWLVTPSLYIFGLVWLTTVIALTLFLFYNLSKYRRFLKADFLGHTVAGLVTVASASLVLCYVLQVKSDEMCEKEHLKEEFMEAWRNNNPNHLGIPLTRQSPNFTAILDEVMPKCREIESKTYLQGHFLVGGLLALFTGILYSAIGTTAILSGSTSDTDEKDG